jgi:oligoribonuclease NrnB/cAMP/cGMP phosphodiesterase (DHH superfamily)
MNRIFFHKMDHDGKLSGAIARKYFEEKGEAYYLYPFNYDMEIPVEQFSKEDKIFFLDVTSNPYNKIQALIDLGFNVTICDHHKSFLETGIQNQVKGNCSIDKAGCELTWKYFYPNEAVPEFVRLLGRYDIWDKYNEDWETRILPFQWGMRNNRTDPINSYEIWSDLFSDQDGSILSAILNDGKLILDYQKKSYSGMLHSYGFDAHFEDYPDLRLICLNSPGGNSMMFDDKWDPTLYDAMFVFVCKGENYICSLYTVKDIDLSEIAKNYGGGGHAGACGFTAKKVEIENGVIKLSGLGARNE